MQDFNIMLNQIVEDLQKGFREITEIFGRFADTIKNELLPILDGYYEVLKNKKKYKPILKISPNKTYIRDKKLNNHYCRNNC